MPKRNLSQTYVYLGKFYGPGDDLEIPDDFAKELDARAKAEAEAAKAEKAAQAAAPENQGQDEVEAEAAKAQAAEDEKPTARRPGDAPTKPVR